MTATMTTASRATAAGFWTLTECRDDGAAGQHLTIPAAPTTIGRTAETPITLACSSVSKRHAEIRMELGRPVLSDLGSTNGTYVNGRPADKTPLAHGDVVQFASKVFRVGKPMTAEMGATTEGAAFSFAAALLQFEELMSGAGVVPHFQPIVRLPDGVVEGYELLARSQLEELRSPAAMFSTAARLGQECALSELMRREGVRDALRLADCGNLFVNTHPKEIVQERFLASLYELRELAPLLTITIEVHEAAITSSEDMKRFRHILDGLSMQLAYDDFGAGQARLDELSEAPPDCLKFDIKLIHDLDKATSARLAMVTTLVAMTRDLGIRALAEGVETAEEARICYEVGFELAQGYYFGKPSAADTILGRFGSN
jgi:EAL domain-containing protein (putative c-di-GMP-specific phosphodiesterase class I)